MFPKTNKLKCFRELINETITTSILRAKTPPFIMKK